VLILAIGIERLAELIVSKRNARWAFAHRRRLREGARPLVANIETSDTDALAAT
jgi:hypothetical protein